MSEIIVEFHYWNYGEYSKTAMDSKTEIKVDELESLAQEFNVKVEVKKVAAVYFTLVRIGWRLPHYDKIVVKVVGERAEDIKAYVGRVFLLYGRPDEIPRAIFGGRKTGRIIIEELLMGIKGEKNNSRTQLRL